MTFHVISTNLPDMSYHYKIVVVFQIIYYHCACLWATIVTYQPFYPSLSREILNVKLFFTFSAKLELIWLKLDPYYWIYLWIFKKVIFQWLNCLRVWGKQKMKGYKPYFWGRLSLLNAPLLLNSQNKGPTKELWYRF